MRKFLKNARSLLKIFGRRPKFRGIFPISPYLVGLVKHEAFKKSGVPVGSKPPAPSLALLQLTNGSALTEPPVKSVIGVHEVVVVPGVPGNEPTGHGCPFETLTEVLEYETDRSFGLPVANEVVPEICHPPSTPLTSQ